MIKMLVFRGEGVSGGKWVKSSYSVDSAFHMDKDMTYWLKTVGYLKLNHTEYFDAERNKLNLPALYENYWYRKKL